MCWWNKNRTCGTWFSLESDSPATYQHYECSRWRNHPGPHRTKRGYEWEASRG